MSGSIAAGEPLELEVLGRGRVVGVVESVDEVRPMGGLPGMTWRVTVVLPGGDRAEAIRFGDGSLGFLDPRYRPA